MWNSAFLTNSQVMRIADLGTTLPSRVLIDSRDGQQLVSPSPIGTYIKELSKERFKGSGVVERMVARNAWPFLWSISSSTSA